MPRRIADRQVGHMFEVARTTAKGSHAIQTIFAEKSKQETENWNCNSLKIANFQKIFLLTCHWSVLFLWNPASHFSFYEEQSNGIHEKEEKWRHPGHPAPQKEKIGIKLFSKFVRGDDKKGLTIGNRTRKCKLEKKIFFVRLPSCIIHQKLSTPSHLFG